MTFLKFLKKIPAVDAALSIAAIGLTKTIIAQRFIPNNLDWLSSAGITVAIIAFLFVFARLVRPAAKVPLVITAVICFVSLLVMQVGLVEPLSPFGEPIHDLRGWKLSKGGEFIKHNTEEALHTTDMPIHELLVNNYGPSYMLQIFGDNWYLSVALYSGSFIMLLFSIISVVGIFEMEYKDSPKTGL
jgi:hypothetical protein